MPPAHFFPQSWSHSFHIQTLDDFLAALFNSKLSFRPSKSITIMVQLCPIIIVSLAIRTAFVLAAPVHDGSMSSVAAPQAHQCRYNPPQDPKAGNRRGLADDVKSSDAYDATFIMSLPERYFKEMVSDIEKSLEYNACKAKVDPIIRDWTKDPNDEELKSEIVFWWDHLLHDSKIFQNQVNEMKANSAHPGETAESKHKRSRNDLD
ncbi:hypothetical protein DFJ43DRAFT_1227799 [Lentinula guzmanii]|uniref:Uncharacterized protein n=1 Tax=Lentinula guzmanii TaxID=2804957 RepID=A0AA38J440_9AGAR|nr:hypothetical protein DFJ43DRAFT_1227799 [Lentinula guzmanii]